MRKTGDSLGCHGRSRFRILERKVKGLLQESLPFLVIPRPQTGCNIDEITHTAAVARAKCRSVDLESAFEKGVNIRPRLLHPVNANEQI